MDWSYIAGFFDGEGCVSHEGKTRRPICTMVQTDGDHFVIEKIQAFLTQEGIKTSLSCHASRKNQTKSHKRLLISASFAVEDFLSKVIPFLIVKKSKAIEALRESTASNTWRKAREESVNRAAKEYSAGVLNMHEVAAKYGIGYRRLLNKLSELGIRKRHRWENGTWRDVRGRFKITRRDAEIVKNMPLVLLSVADIARVLNCHNSTIRLMRSGKTWRHI